VTHALRTAAPLVLVAALLAGCSTHRADLDPNAVSTGPDSAREEQIAIDAVRALLDHKPRGIRRLGAEALAALASAGATAASATGDPDLAALSHRYADALLRTQADRGTIHGFGRTATDDAPDVTVTGLAALALLDAEEATGDSRYGAEARQAARAIVKPRFGWAEGRGDVGVAVRNRISISLTATAWLLLRRTGNVYQAGRARNTVLGNQAAVGRWYALLGTRIPMQLTEWARTLDAAVADPSPNAQGILGAGVPAIYAAAFKTSGAPRSNVNSKGVALALGVLAQYADTRYAERAFAAIKEQMRPDGRIRLGVRDATTQAYFALAFARWLGALNSSGS
jgi:hypothetical protein